MQISISTDQPRFSLNGTNYFYIRNAQSDIIRILDKDGNKVVNYIYDSWGKLINTSGSLASTVGSQNPFRYRGYYYDNETGFYSLHSRYYDPEIGRFINADDTKILFEKQDNLTEHNLYAYCFNSPIIHYDPTGYIVQVIAGLSAAAIAAVVQAVCVTIIVGSVIYITYKIYKMSKGGRQNIRDSGLAGLSDAEIQRRLKDPNTSKSEKQRLQKEQKARGDRNKQKRGKKK